MSQQEYRNLPAAGLEACTDVAREVDLEATRNGGGWPCLYLRNMNAAAGSVIIVRILANSGDAGADNTAAPTCYKDQLVLEGTEVMRIHLKSLRFMSVRCLAGQTGNLRWYCTRD